MSLILRRSFRHVIGGMLLALGMLLVPAAGRASSEQPLVLSSFSLVTTSPTDARPIKVWGTQSASGVEALNIEAFDRKFRLSAAQLSELRGLTVNNVQLSFDSAMIKRLPDRLLVQLALGRIADGLIKTKVVYVHSNGELSMRSPFEQ
ncbi:hypothetical protein [Duganella radicis]|uniref:Uncharacterized protein n=1 Tax=Duganella radicis TaxID=551988 RepID=A0A6L6PNL2_9BURK|nr:hypothetical protein [Duganella radicis]MTV40201.1 hypothetical protein [Duganella radicis]